MQKDLLAELHLPKLDFKSIQNIVAQNSARLSCLIKENNEYVKKSKTVSPHFEGLVKSTVSDCSEINPSLPLSEQNIKTVKRKFLLTKSLISGHNFKNGVKISYPPSILTKNSTVVPDALRNGITEDGHKQKCMEVRSFSAKSFSNSNNLRSKTKLNTNSIVISELTSCGKIEPLKSVVSRGFSRKRIEKQAHLGINTNKCLISDPLIVNSHVSVLKSKDNSSLHTEFKNQEDIDKRPEPTSDSEKESESAFCVISEVIGNATDAFSKADDPEENIDETPEPPLIIPQKTNDITKIKGWRRKQFFVEKPTTIEFYSIAKGSLTLKKKIELKNYNDNTEKNTEESDNVKNAFVCDSLDEFLDQEAELKVSFEIPHLFAEFGIKLTSDDIVSKPKLSEKDIKEVETRYCVPISSPCGEANLNEIEEENVKSLKRPIEDDTKPCKVLKVEESKRQSIRSAQKSAEIIAESESNGNILESNHSVENRESNELKKSFSNVKLVNKLIALVVYPGPFMPLHPIVQYHLAKIRSYRTVVDQNWANFAASAVLFNEKRYERSILPVQCCVKIETSPVVTDNKDLKVIEQKINSASSTSVGEGDNSNKIIVKNQYKLKKCSVVIEKLNGMNALSPWCMEHNCYNCVECGLAKTKLKKFKSQELRRKTKNENPADTFIVSPRASFDKEIASLLAKKVRLLKYNGDTLTNIDCLKTLAPNTVEFIKLKFVKESLLTGYTNIWYLEPEEPEVRSRAFLTFSQTPPVPNAINLKSNASSVNNLPKVITEIISEENTFDSNDYAILHCNGKIWEIHGSLNIAFGKNGKNVEQIFTSAELPELKKLQKIAFDILHVKAVKWWVLDLTQKFRLIELKSGNFSSVIVRKKFIESIELNLFGFVPLRRNLDNRVLGVYIIQRLLPFILIGPYYLFETHDLTLRGESSIIPFAYYGEKNVTTNCPLKFFINSIIKNLEEANKQLEGIWLYDKMNLDNTSYLEVVTANLSEPLTNKYSSIDIEHGYSLNSLTNPLSSGVTSGIIKRKDGKEEFKKVTVYLYFDIFELGFVEGELQFDNSVIINHPLDERTKMKSHKIGDWFIGIIKRRIDFMPKDLMVRWFITKYKEDLRDRRPFNKFFLDGAHILTRNGVYYLLEMSDSTIEKLGLSKSEVLKAINESEVIKEVRALKELADLFPNNSKKSLAMDEVLTKAVKEIKWQKSLERNLRNKKKLAQKEKLNLVSHFIKAVNNGRIPFHVKMRMIESIVPSFTKDNGELTEEFVKKLKMSRIGWRYFKRFEKKHVTKVLKKKVMRMKIIGKLMTKTNKPGAKKSTKKQSKSEKVSVAPNPQQKARPPERNRTSEKSSITLSKIPITRSKTYKNSNETKIDRPKYPELHLQIEKLNSISDRCSSFKNIYSKVIKSSTSEKEQAEESFEKKQINKTNFLIPNNITTKRNGFVRLTSPELPENIKLGWKNWVVNKLEVV